MKEKVKNVGIGDTHNFPIKQRVSIQEEKKVNKSEEETVHQRYKKEIDEFYNGPGFIGQVTRDTAVRTVSCFLL